jgi:protein TonB
VLIIVPLFVLDVPAARRAVEFMRITAAELPDVPPPPAPSRSAHSEQSPARDVAPTVAPNRIEPEVISPPAGRGLEIEGPPGATAGFSAGVPLRAVPVAPPAPPAPPTPYRPGGKIRAPHKIKDVAPVYPQIAQISRIEGTVILDAVIGENGRVRDVRVVRSFPMLDQAAVDAVRQWIYTPTLLNGEPVPVIMTVTVAFKLH